MIEISTDFPYLGARNYIHGTSILGGFLDALEAHGHHNITVKRLKFQRPAQSNGRLTLTAENIADGKAETANCTFLATVNGSVWRGAFHEQGAAPTRRVTVRYPITDLKAQGLGGTCCIAPANRDDLIRAFVEANKRFHEAGMDQAAGLAVRLGYLENWAAPGREAGFSGELQAVNLITRKTDDGCMTINRLTYHDGAAHGASLMLCFNLTAGAKS